MPETSAASAALDVCRITIYYTVRRFDAIHLKSSRGPDAVLQRWRRPRGVCAFSIPCVRLNPKAVLARRSAMTAKRDLTSQPRLLAISALAVGIGVLASGVAWALF